MLLAREGEGRRGLKGVRAELPRLHQWHLLQYLSLECAIAGSSEGSHAASGQCARKWKKKGVLPGRSRALLGSSGGPCGVLGGVIWSICGRCSCPQAVSEANIAKSLNLLSQGLENEVEMYQKIRKEKIRERREQREPRRIGQ